VNDSKATNIEAATRAVESFARGVVPILGGRFKGGDWRDLRPAIAARALAVVAVAGYLAVAGVSAVMLRR